VQETNVLEPPACMSSRQEIAESCPIYMMNTINIMSIDYLGPDKQQKLLTNLNDNSFLVYWISFRNIT